MKLSHLVSATGLLALAGCVHTPPGTSVEVALAKKAEMVRLPLPTVAASVPIGAPVNVPAVEPMLPEGGGVVEQVGEAYSRGIFCLQAGNDAEAIAAFEEAVKLDPTFVEAWQNLATLYEKVGDKEKALEAFRRSKKIARQ